MSIARRQVYGFHDFIPVLNIVFSHCFYQMGDGATLITPRIEQIAGKHLRWYLLNSLFEVFTGQLPVLEDLLACQFLLA